MIMRSVFLAACGFFAFSGAAHAEAQTAPAGVPVSAEPRTYLECSAWAQVLAGQPDMEDEVRAGLTYAAIFFLGRYEGMTGQPFQTGLSADDVNAIGERLEAMNEPCLPLMSDFGERMNELGESLDGPEQP